MLYFEKSYLWLRQYLTIECERFYWHWKQIQKASIFVKDAICSELRASVLADGHLQCGHFSQQSIVRKIEKVCKGWLNGKFGGSKKAEGVGRSANSQGPHSQFTAQWSRQLLPKLTTPPSIWPWLLSLYYLYPIVNSVLWVWQKTRNLDLELAARENDLWKVSVVSKTNNWKRTNAQVRLISEWGHTLAQLAQGHNFLHNGCCVEVISWQNFSMFIYHSLFLSKK